MRERVVMKLYREISVLKGIQLCVFISILFLITPNPNSFGQSKFSCRKWTQLSSQTKLAVLTMVMKMHADSENIKFKFLPSYYVSELDTLIKTYLDTRNEDAMNSSLGLTFRTIAVMDGDWNNGVK